jgi:hypothetical protein
MSYTGVVLLWQEVVKAARKTGRSRQAAALLALLGRIILEIMSLL